MRSALLFANKVFLPALVLVYVLAMLASSCMPLSDTMGEAQAIPRWEFWLLHASAPSAIWWQWTGGLQPIVIVDRIPILTLAVAWLSACWVVGNQISKFDLVSNRLSKYERMGVSILVGQSVLASVVFLIGWLLGVQPVAWVLIALTLCGVVLWRFQSITRESIPACEPGIAIKPTTSSTAAESDASFSSSVRRRMIGLLILATVFLAGFHVLGATMPTHDVQVREVDWWLVKHAAMEGKIRWSTDHALANAPAGLGMSSVAFASVLTIDLPSPSLTQNDSDWLAIRKKWNARLLTGVLAGKTTNAMLCLVGCLFVSVHVGRRCGFLPGLFVGFLLVATPGIAELMRLGRTEVFTGVWCAALAVVWQASTLTTGKRLPLGVLWGLLVAGAISSGYASAVLVGLPAIGMWLTSCWQGGRIFDDKSSKAFTLAMAVGVLLSASAFYLRNAIATGDPIYPLGGVFAQQVGAIGHTEFRDALHFSNRVPSETIAESIAAAGDDLVAENAARSLSPYRISNLLDGLFRLLGNSNVHGLMLVPLALVGVLLGRLRSDRVVCLWFLYWITIWWVFFTRQDRDWVGAVVLLAWPAAFGVEWLLDRARGYFVMLLVSIAIVWSMVALPVWPTSDNRILVSLETLSRRGQSSAGDSVAEAAVSKNPESDTRNTTDYASVFRSILERPVAGKSQFKVLLVGESDDFDFLSDCITNGSFDGGLLDKCAELTALESAAMLQSRGVTHVLVVWSGVQYRERLTGRKIESGYRSTIGNLVNESCLKPIPWEISSSQAELFRVNEER